MSKNTRAESPRYVPLGLAGLVYLRSVTLRDAPFDVAAERSLRPVVTR